jgi:hypothetical protein
MAFKCNPEDPQRIIQFEKAQSQMKSGVSSDRLSKLPIFKPDV